MLPRPSRRIALVSFIAAAAALSACAADYGMPRATSMVTLTATMSGSQEVPPNMTGGMGQARVTFNKDTGDLQYTVSYSGLTGPATGAHIHGPAAAGTNAGVKVPFPNPASPITGSAKLEPAQAADLLAGLYYVNVHTAANPGGEIRGQLKLAP